MKAGLVALLNVCSAVMIAGLVWFFQHAIDEKGEP